MSFDLFLTEPYFQRVLATALIVAATASIVGVFLVQRGMALFGDGVAHMSFAGIAVGFVTGWLPLGIAFVASAVGALGVQELHRRDWARSDAALGIVYTSALALGVVLVSSQGAVPPDVESYLFGNLILSSAQDFVIASVVAIVVAGVIAVMWRPFMLLSFGEERAQVQGLPARGLNTLFTLLTALTVVATVRVVGVLLVSALLIIPASAANRLARSMRQAIAIAAGFAVTAVLVGLAVSAELGLASGATIALTAAGLFLATIMVRPRA